MLIVLLIIGIILLVLGIVFLIRTGEDAFAALIIPGVFLTTGIVIAMFFVGNNVLTYNQMDERITVYQEENLRIEEQIKTTVEAYQEYEKEIFGNIDLEKISGDKLILLTSIYPELKSDALVQELISVYVENNNQIKELKTKKLDYKISCWWLYFG